jgi:hypothetical protein
LRPVETFGEIDMIGDRGRSRATRSAVAPEEVQHDRVEIERFGDPCAAAAMASAPVASGSGAGHR